MECHRAGLVLNSLPATVISDLVSVYLPDITAVSTGVMSVIKDYIETALPVIQGNIKFIRLRKQSGGEKRTNIIACLARAGFKLSIVISITSDVSVYFFIKEKKKSEELRQLSKQKAGLGKPSLKKKIYGKFHMLEGQVSDANSIIQKKYSLFQF